MNDFFKGFEQLLELAKTLEEKAENGELKTDIRINSRGLSSIPRQGNIPNDIGVSRIRTPAGDEESDDDVIVTPPPAESTAAADHDASTTAPPSASGAAQQSPTQPVANNPSLKDVGGLTPVIQELRELVEIPLKRPEVLAQLGLEPPRGVMLVGPPGTGKTLTARSLAEELGVSYIAIVGPEIMGKYYGEAEGRLRKVFEKAAKSAPCLIFIDEIDSLFKFDFNDDFFALIRSFYQERSDLNEFNRLSFVLLGVATPNDLIRDKKRTSFNIGGQCIDLQGFKADEVEPLATGLGQQAENPTAVLTEILRWTKGQPFLTQRLCQLIAESNFGIAAGSEQDLVAQLVQSRVIDDWEAQDVSVHLKTIRDRILANKNILGRLLGLYQSILHLGKVPTNSSNEQIELRLSGLIREEQNNLLIANPIYEKVFNKAWINTELLKLRPYGEAINGWLMSGRQDDTWL